MSAWKTVQAGTEEIGNYNFRFWSPRLWTLRKEDVAIFRRVNWCFMAFVTDFELIEVWHEVVKSVNLREKKPDILVAKIFVHTLLCG